MLTIDFELYAHLQEIVIGYHNMFGSSELWEVFRFTF
jgi:hypothetical protein